MEKSHKVTAVIATEVYAACSWFVDLSTAFRAHILTASARRGRLRQLLALRVAELLFS